MIASEYGWTDQYILNELPYHRFLSLLRSIKERQQVENDRTMIGELFSTYQLIETIISVNDIESSYKGRSFRKYLRDLKLDDLLRRNFKISKSEKKRKIEEAENNVVDAVKMFSKGGE